MASVHGVDFLQNEIEKAKESLKGVDENLKRVMGRDPSQRGAENRGLGGSGPMVNRRRVTVGGTGSFRGRERTFNTGDRRGAGGGLEIYSPPAKRRNMGQGVTARLGGRVGGRQGRDSGDEEELPNKPTILSSVVPTPEAVKSRKDSIDEQNKDERGKQRNRRMFGMLLGTLKRFKDDSKQDTQKENSRKEIEKKLEEKALQEKDAIKREREELFQERRSQQTKLRRLEHKMELVQLQEQWEKETLKMKNFIRTKVKPHIFYLPKSHVEETSKRLADTKTVLDELIKTRKQKLQMRIEKMNQKEEARDRRAQGIQEDEQESSGEEDNDEADDKPKNKDKAEGDEDGSRKIKVEDKDGDKGEEGKGRPRERRFSEREKRPRSGEGRDRSKPRSGERDEGRSRDKGSRKHSDKREGSKHRSGERDRKSRSKSRDRRRGRHRSGDRQSRSKSKERGKHGGEGRRSRERNNDKDKRRSRERRHSGRDKKESGRRESVERDGSPTAGKKSVKGRESREGSVGQDARREDKEGKSDQVEKTEPMEHDGEKEMHEAQDTSSDKLPKDSEEIDEGENSMDTETSNVNENGET